MLDIDTNLTEDVPAVPCRLSALKQGGQRSAPHGGANHPNSGPCLEGALWLIRSISAPARRAACCKLTGPGGRVGHGRHQCERGVARLGRNRHHRWYEKPSRGLPETSPGGPRPVRWGQPDDFAGHRGLPGQPWRRISMSGSAITIDGGLFDQTAVRAQLQSPRIVLLSVADPRHRPAC